MEILLIILRLLLATVFAVAGITKLFDLRGARQAMRDFGLPPGPAGVAGVALPVAELVVAAMLLFAATAWWGALAALGLLVMFVGAIVYHMTQGRTPNCHCFGQLHSQPIGKSTLIRNGVLAAAAGLLVVQGPNAVMPTLFGGLGQLSPVGVWLILGGLVVLAAIGGLGWVVLNLLRQNGRLLLRIEALENQLGIVPVDAAAPAQLGLDVGMPAPAFQLTDLDGNLHAGATLWARGKPVLLLFSSPTCAPCRELLPEVAAWQREHGEKLSVILVSRGDVERMRAHATAHNLVDVFLQHDNEVGTRFGATGTPSAVLIDASGIVRSPVAAGAGAVRDLVLQSARPLDALRARLVRPAPIPLETLPTQANPTDLQPGMAAPSVRLANLEGDLVDLAQWRGRPLLVLFWNPDCGFCRRMLTDLQAWEVQPTPDAPRLVLISSGSVEANRAQGLQTPILLDEGFQTGFAFGARGTPAAVLIDAQGQIATPVVVGAPAVLALLQPAPVLPSHSHRLAA